MVENLSILITGSNGQLGSCIRDIHKNFPQYKFFFTDSSSFDITSDISMSNFLDDKQIDYIINCAAYTNVNECEIDNEKSDKANNIALKKLGKICFESRIKIIHFSSDYVFDGKKRVFKESDRTNPLSNYGLSKLHGEKKLLEYLLPQSIIIRTSWLYSKYGNNFVMNIIKQCKSNNEINVVADQIGSPTYAGDLARFVLEVIPNLKNNKIEVYHFSNGGHCSRYELAKEIVHHLKKKIKVNKLYSADKIRPKRCILDKSKILKDFSFDIVNWKESLKIFMNENKN